MEGGRKALLPSLPGLWLPGGQQQPQHIQRLGRSCHLRGAWGKEALNQPRGVAFLGEMTFLQPWGVGTTPTRYTIQAADLDLPGAPLHTQVRALEGRIRLLLTLPCPRARHRAGRRPALRLQDDYFIYRNPVGDDCLTPISQIRR